MWKPVNTHGVPCRVGDYDEEFVVHLHTRDDVGIGTSLDLWRICIQRMRPTVDVNLSSGHFESVRTRLVLISCVSDHARCMAQAHV